MHTRAALAAVGLVFASGFEQQCEVDASERAAWAAASTDALRALGYEVSAGAAEGARWQFAPLGTISNPGGTYGVVDLGSNASKFPGGDDYCRCLNGDVSVSAACAQIGVAVDSGGARETLCKGSFVLRPQDAVVLLACMPPSAEYWGWQTNVLARWGESADEGGEGVYFPQVSMIDTLNNLVVNTTGGAAGPWERVVAVIVTADARAWMSERRGIAR